MPVIFHNKYTIIYFHLGEQSSEDFRKQKADVGDEMFA